MKKMTSLIVMTIASLMVVGSAMAYPVSIGSPPSGEDSLQQILNDNIVDDLIDAYSDQSGVEAWQSVDGGSNAYAVAFMKGHAGDFGIYSTATLEEIVLMSNPSTDTPTTNFDIFADGRLLYNGFTYSGFGSFGFFWLDTTSGGDTAYTQSYLNAGTGYGSNDNIRALSYLVPDKTYLEGELGSQIWGSQAIGNDDWILAFEDLSSVGGDGDFNDAVLYVTDISRVPEPRTLALFGVGLLGLGFYGHRRMKKPSHGTRL